MADDGGLRRLRVVPIPVAVPNSATLLETLATGLGGYQAFFRTPGH